MFQYLSYLLTALNPLPNKSYLEPIFVEFNVYFDNVSADRIQQLINQTMKSKNEKIDQTDILTSHLSDIFSDIDQIIAESNIKASFKLMPIMETDGEPFPDCKTDHSITTYLFNIKGKVQRENLESLANRIYVVSCPDRMKLYPSVLTDDCESISGFIFNNSLDDEFEAMKHLIMEVIAKGPVNFDRLEKEEKYNNEILDRIARYGDRCLTYNSL